MYLRFPACLLIPASLFAKTTITPDADAYVSNAARTTAFGSGATLVANSSNGVRICYLRFDLSSVPRPITRITLDLTSSGTGMDSYHVFGLTEGENWVENSMNWNNAPGLNNAFITTPGTLSQIIESDELYASGTPLSTFSAPGASDTHNRVLDVTRGPVFDFISADEDQVVTFLIVEQDPPDTSGLSWHSKEATTAAFRPKMSFYGPGEDWETIRIVLIGGQSNGDGRAAGSALPAALQLPQETIPFYYHTDNASANADSSLGILTNLRPGATRTPVGGFGPEITLGKSLGPLIESLPGTRLAIIKFAQGGTNLHTQWKGNGDPSSATDGTVYQTWQRVVKNGLARIGADHPESRIDVAAMTWIQGESDVTSGQTEPGYRTNLENFIQDVRQTFRANLPFLIARLSGNQTALSSPSDPDYQGYLAVRAAQESVAASTPGVSIIDCDGSLFPMQGDGLHYAADGLQEMGRRFGAKLAETMILRHAIHRNDLGGFVLQWNAIEGRKYDVDVSEDLKTWSSFPAGVTSEWTDAGGQSRRFYRVTEAD
jgi:hypothetical protein